MSAYIFDNFDPAIYYGAFTEEILIENIDVTWPTNSGWILWLIGKNSKISKNIASCLYEDFAKLLRAFCEHCDNLNLTDDTYTLDNVEKIRVSIVDSWDYQQPSIAWSEGEMSRRDYLFENIKVDGNTRIIALMCVYGMLKIDSTITGLLSSDTTMVAESILFYKGMVDIIDEHYKQQKIDYNSKKTLSEFSRRNANKRHIKTNELKAEVIEFWRKNIDIELSNEVSAERLEKIFPLEWTTLRDYVSEAKRNLKMQSTSKP